jgi:glycosyltransferase involved in cell wall biosynthesis
MPEVSIGLPVYNGARFLEAAIRSILTQTFTEFELIISDNASTDATCKICSRFAALDPRVRYIRNLANLGATKNFNKVFRLASGRYFKWAAHDDVIAPQFLERCVEVLRRDTEAVLCYPRVRFIDATDHFINEYELPCGHATSPEPQKRFSDVICTNHWCFQVFGLIRAESLVRTRLLGAHATADRVLLTELALLGRFREVPEPMFQRIVLPHWRMMVEYGRVVGSSPLTRGQRLTCYLHMLRWLTKHRNAAWLAVDLIVAVVPKSWDLVFARLKKRRYRRHERIVVQ